MKVTEYIFASKKATASFAVAAALLLAAGVGGTRAALTSFSDDYVGTVNVSELEVTLTENGKEVTDGKLLSDISDFKLNKTYDEVIAAKNSGTQDEYVRAIITKSFTVDGKSNTSLDPDMITITTADGIKVDDTTAERTVMYYTDILPVGESAVFTTDFTVNGNLAGKVTTTEETKDNVKYITTTYTYDNVSFTLKAEVQSLQTHNARSAMISSWGLTDAQVSEIYGNIE